MYSSSRLVRLPTESGIWPPRPGRLPNWRLLTLERFPRVGGIWPWRPVKLAIIRVSREDAQSPVGWCH